MTPRRPRVLRWALALALGVALVTAPARGLRAELFALLAFVLLMHFAQTRFRSSAHGS